MPDPDPSIDLSRVPSVNRILERIAETGDLADVPRSIVTEAVRDVLDDERRRLREGLDPRDEATLVERSVALTRHEQRAPLSPVINATGIIIHTGLGRAPLAPSAARAALAAATRYAPVELDLPGGRRGKRALLVRSRLCRLTGAESATVVNNNAAALVLTLAALASGRRVVVSRGELIEIGGSFRLPDVMETGGARLAEVGTTNRTRLRDYEDAIDEHAAAILKVHPSNYRVEGFTEETGFKDLADLAHRHELPLIADIGSGVLEDDPTLADEPAARSALQAGADVVMFSGDKLLGGPQAGIIVGRAELIDLIERHPLMRAMRVDAITLAALAATLDLHEDPGRRDELPVRAMHAATLDDLTERGRRIVAALPATSGLVTRVAASNAYLGGGSVPAHAVPSMAVVIRHAEIDEEDLARRLRSGAPAVVPRVSDGAVWIDMRTVFPDEDETLIGAIIAAL